MRGKTCDGPRPFSLWSGASKPAPDTHFGEEHALGSSCGLLPLPRALSLGETCPTPAMHDRTEMSADSQ